MFTTIIHSKALDTAQQAALRELFKATPERSGNCHRVRHASPVNPDSVRHLTQQLQIDINTLPQKFDPARVRLLISDMDSTLITIECVDEIADFVGLKPQVAAITEAAMRGELDFAASLKKRVHLLKGLDVSALQHVYAERLRLNPGAEALLAGLKSRGVKMALVSGGFTYFTERLKQRLALDFTLANVLGIENGKLTGDVKGEVISEVNGDINDDIVGAEAKAKFLIQLCTQLGIAPNQAIAIGDGANDLKMLGTAGLGVAYHAKPRVRGQADVAIDHGGLDAILDFLG